MTLNKLEIGKTGLITTVGGEGALRQHFLDMGVIPGSEITVVKYAPMGDPIELRIHDYELTLRLDDAKKIEIQPVQENLSEDCISSEKKQKSAKSEKISLSSKSNKSEKDSVQGMQRFTAHPGLGEGGKFHSKKDENPLPDNHVLTFALVGNQNCGKTTLFNQLTGSNQHVGNFPGVTVSRKDGQIRGYPNTLITDLPGIYSMSPYTSEELVTRDFVLTEKPDAIINIVDATNIERNLYLTMQLMELDVPMVLALNMMDEVIGNGGTIKINDLESLLGIPVIPISAAKNQGITELIQHAVHVAKYQEKPLRQDFCDEKDRNGAIHRALHSIIHLIFDHAEDAKIPVRFAASKILEGDSLILQALNFEKNEIELLEHIALQMEKESGLDRQASIADMRFSFIRKVCSATVKKPRESKEHIRSNKIDRILTGKYTAIPVFILIMGLVFFLTFNVIGAWLQGLLEKGIDYLTMGTDLLLEKAGVNELVHGLIIDGIFAGVGGVLSFLPIIVTLFFFLSMMEDSGYIARVAFVMDKLLRKIGLSGRSIVPMLIGFGCTVPAVMSTRTLPSERDRKMTILLTPFMSCSAKLPIYTFFVDAIFPSHKALIMIGLYVFGIITGILVALLFKRTLFKGEAVPFVMELPNYRLPGLKNVAQLLWEKAKDFLTRAFTVIFMATLIIWVLQTFDYHFRIVSDSSQSILALLGGLIAPIFKPLGLGDWKYCTSFISGFIAKESVVSTLTVLFGSKETIASVMSASSAAALLIFSLIYTPCVAAITSIKRELGAKYAAGVVIWQCVLAWILAFLVKLVVSLIA